jgi:hypothetical protein
VQRAQMYCTARRQFAKVYIRVFLTTYNSSSQFTASRLPVFVSSLSGNCTGHSLEVT